MFYVRISQGFLQLGQKTPLQSRRHHKTAKGWFYFSIYYYFKIISIFILLKLAATLQKLANAPDPAALFYNGTLGEAIIKEINDGGFKSILFENL